MKNFILAIIIFTGCLTTYQTAVAHCDTKNGPVVMAAKKALSTNNVNFVLIWVRSEDEAQIKQAFQTTMELRKLCPPVQDAIDNYFFETLVRIHRAGEGVAYTGIKDSGEVEIPIAAADDAIEKNSLADVMKLLNEVISKGVNEKFNEAISKYNYDKDNVEAGREYIESYVLFMHYVEAIYNAASHMGTEHQEHKTANAGREMKSTPTVGTENKNQPDHLTHILIIGGTLLIIVAQIILSRKKSVN